MTNYKGVFMRFVALLVVVASIVGCTTEVDYTMGEEFVPSSQKMELRRRVYSAGKMTEGDSQQSLPLSATRLYRTDSLPSANMTHAYFGREKSDTFGIRTAGFLTQMMFGMTLPEDRGWGYRPIFDSMTLNLRIADYHGDTTYKQRFEVYEIISNDYFSLPEKGDTTFYINFDPTPYISSEPIFEFTFPNQQKGVYVGNIDDPQDCQVLLEETPATQQYIERLMLLTTLDDNDGYALDKEGMYDTKNQKEFVEKVRGIYVKPADDDSSERGAMYATTIDGSYLYLYSRGRYEEDPTIIRDTTHMSYNFYINPKEFDVKAGNVSINTVQHDFSNVTLFDRADVEVGATERSEVLVGYVDGMGGIVTEVTLSDEFIQSLADIATSHEDAIVSVNQAHLSVYLEGSDYDYNAIDPLTITPLMNGAMSRMGLYTDYRNRIAIADYLHTQEGSYTTAYDGYLNRSLANYTMDVSSYVQSLMMAAADNLLDDGKTVNLAKFRADYEPKNESLVSFRRIYLGPEAGGMFCFQRQAILGGDGEVAGITNSSPIKLEIVYTVIN